MGIAQDLRGAKVTRAVGKREESGTGRGLEKYEHWFTTGQTRAGFMLYTV